MTDHAEISRQLALAIGYLPEHVSNFSDKILVNRLLIYDGRTKCLWRHFDYRMADVIWPIAAKYEIFPFFGGATGKWISYDKKKYYEADTPELVAALALIGRPKNDR